jgi:ATP-binding cassette subfamily B (MDR/TAP) protein 1
VWLVSGIVDSSHANQTEADNIPAGTFPGQAMLMSRLVNVFQYTGSEMEEKGNFFALMNLVIAIGCLIVYFIIGYTANSISTVGLETSLPRT